MRLLTAIAAVVVCTAAAQVPPPPPGSPAIPPELRRCAEMRTPEACGVSKSELKQARKDFQRGLRLQKNGHAEDAYEAIAAAADLVPRNLEYVTAREVLRQQIVMRHVESGNALLLQQKREQAGAEFRQAFALDPSNAFAQQRLRDAADTKVQAKLSNFRTEDGLGEIAVGPSAQKQNFHLRADTRGVLEQICAAFGIRPVFDETVTSRQVRFDIDDVDFWAAMRVASSMTKTFWAPLSAKQVLIAADTPANRAQYERMAERTFYLPDATTTAELNDVANLFRTMFDIRFISQQPGGFAITARAPRRLLEAATELLRSLDGSRPQVMLEFHVFQVSESMLRAIGLDLPLQWQAFNLTSAALSALQQPNVQDLINQLIASGGINQANTTAVSALLAQLQAQQNSLFKNPFGTFGGGTTRFAVPFPPATANFSLNEARVTTLDQVTLRAAQGNAATMLIGSRYPILNATFAPIFNTAAISQVIQNNSFIAPFPSFTYEDLGITIKATPQIHREDVALDMNLEIRALGTQAFNGVPVISNRQFTTGISVRDGETAIIAGTLDNSEQNTLSGVPGLSRIPILRTATSNRSVQRSTSELLVLVTPHVVKMPDRAGGMVVVPPTE